MTCAALDEFRAWAEACPPSPRREACEEAVQTVLYIEDDAADICSVALDALAKLAQTKLARRELSALLVDEARECSADLVGELAKQVQARLSHQYCTPTAHLFYLYVAYQLYEDESMVMGEDVLCSALERTEGGKARLVEAAGRLAATLGRASAEQLTKFAKLACSKRLLRCVRVLGQHVAAAAAQDEASITTLLTQAYVDWAFKQQQQQPAGEAEQQRQLAHAFAPVLEHLAEQQIATLLVPAVSRQVKLTTEKSMPACLELAPLLHKHATAGQLDEMFCQPARKALKQSAKEEVQTMASKLMAKCFAQVEMPLSVSEVLDDVAKEAALFRRCKLVATLTTAKLDPLSSSELQHRAFNSLVKRALKDEKTEDARALCLDTAAHLLLLPSSSSTVPSVDADTLALLPLAVQSAAGLAFVAWLAPRLTTDAAAAKEAVKAKIRAIPVGAEETRLRLPSTLAMLALGGEVKPAVVASLLDVAADSDEADRLMLARMVKLVLGSPAPAVEVAAYAACARLLAVSEPSQRVRAEAMLVLKDGPNNKQVLLACVRSGLVFSRSVIEAAVTGLEHDRNAEVLACALILTYRLKSNTSASASAVSFEKTILPLFHGGGVRSELVKYAAPLLLQSASEEDDEDEQERSVAIDSAALKAAIALNTPSSLSEADVLAIAQPLAQRMDYAARVEQELDEDEAVIAAFSAPTGRLSEYQEARLLAQWESGGTEDEEERAARLLKQGRKGRGGIRKELYSAENLEWERKVRQEQKQKTAQATGDEREKQRLAALAVALREEQELKRTAQREIARYAAACECVVSLCTSSAGGGVSERLSTFVLPLAQQAKRSRFVGQHACAVLDAYLSLAFQRDLRFAKENKPLLVQQLRAGKVAALPTLDAVCSSGGSGVLPAPLNAELFEFVFPILLRVGGPEDDDEEGGSQVVDALFRLVSVHRDSIVPRRDQLLPGLLRLCAHMPLQTSLKCMADLFDDAAAAPPTEAEVDAVLCGELGLLHAEATVRLCALTALAKFKSTSRRFAVLMWFACSDADERCRSKAELIFSGSSPLELPKDYYVELTSAGLLGHATNAQVRAQAAIALALGVDEHPDEAGRAVASLLTKAYAEAKSQYKTAAERAQLAKESKFFDRSLLPSSSSNADDDDVSWRWRSGVAQALSALAGNEGAGSDAGLLAGPVLERKEALECIHFVLQLGTQDPHTGVRAQMLAAGTFLIQAYGQDLGEELLTLVQSSVDGGSKSSSAAEDLQREGAVLLFGAAASNLSADDARIPEIAHKLVLALDTPSESVQRSVVRILPALMKCQQFKLTHAKELVEVCVEKTVGPGVRHHTTFGSRKGNAMGLAAIIKGLGIGSLKHHQLMQRLTEASNNEKLWEARQGALFCFDELCEQLGRMFEPYAIQIVEPVFLRMFSDTQGDVREAAHQASKRVMANLSGPGVGMLLPKLLLGLASQEWRTKHAAIQMLGSVAFCAPKQLASSLPLVVPKLIDTFTDTHAKVRSAAVSALRDVQSVVKNPEIDRIAPQLISALTDPHEKTKDAVDVLFATRFVHEVDAPSLALLIPILKRGLKERVTETKKKSALIIGNMIGMVSDAKAVKPYLEDILPTLRVVLVDPIPGVRVTASKAMGTLVRGLGRDGIPDFAQLYQFLIDTMHHGQSSVERQGGAQGFVEVLAALEDEDLLRDGLELQVFLKVSHDDASVREGAIWGLVFLQTALDSGDEVKPWAARSLDVALLCGLADDVESVRDAAFRCARVYVGEFTTKDPQLVLAALERGLVHSSWRVKHTAVRLLGEFISQLQKTFWGSSAAVVAAAIPLDDDDALAQSDEEEEEEEEDEEEEEAAAAAAATPAEGYESPADGVLQKLFGSDRRNRLISTLYLMRNDSSSQVRQTALHVWKSIVFNTPKMLRRIIGPLMQTTVAFLSSTNADMQSMGGRALADVVRKLGDRVLPDIVPVVLRGLDSAEESERIGVAMGLFELVGASSKTSLEPQCEPVLFAVEKGLCDENDKVRELAGKTFNKVHVVLGGTAALTMVVDKLCQQLDDDDSDKKASAAAIRGLQQCVESRSRDTMTYLVPKLLQMQGGQVTANAWRALGACMHIIPDYLHFYMPDIVRLSVAALASTQADGDDEEQRRVVREEVFVCSTFGESEDAVRVFCREACSAHSQTESAAYKRASLLMLESFLSSDTNVLSEQDAKQCIQSIIRSFASRDDAVLASAIAAFAQLVKHVKDDLSTFVLPVRLAVSTLVSDEKYRGGAFASDELRSKYELPAFQHKPCLDAMLELYLGPLVSNSASHDVRETASIGLGEIVDLSGSAGALKLHTVKIAGPLIRIVGEPFPASLKVSILSTLTKLLAKQGVVLRPFLSQLQTTFVKAVKNNASDAVRVCGLQALEVLVPLTPRVDPLVNELCQGCELGQESGPQMLAALVAVLEARGAEVSVAALGKMLDSPMLSSGEEAQHAEEEEEEDDDEIPHEHGAIAVLLAVIEAKICELAGNAAPDAAGALMDQLVQRAQRRLTGTATWRQLLVVDAMLRSSSSSSPVYQHVAAGVVAAIEAALATSTNPRVRAVAVDCAAVIIYSNKQQQVARAAAVLPPLLSSASKSEKDARVRHFTTATTGSSYTLQSMKDDFRPLF